MGSNKQHVKLCDIRTSRGAVHELAGHTDATWCVQWSPTDEFLVASGSADNTVRLWDVRRSGPTACRCSLDMHQDHAAPIGVLDGGGGGGGGGGGSGGGSGSGGGLHSPGGGGGGAAKRWTRVGTMARAHDGPINGLAFTPNGSQLLTSGTDGRLRRWLIDRVPPDARGELGGGGGVAGRRGGVDTWEEFNDRQAEVHRRADGAGGVLLSSTHFQVRSTQLRILCFMFHFIFYY